MVEIDFFRTRNGREGGRERHQEKERERWIMMQCSNWKQKRKGNDVGFDGGYTVSFLERKKLNFTNADIVVTASLCGK